MAKRQDRFVSDSACQNQLDKLNTPLAAVDQTLPDALKDERNKILPHIDLLRAILPQLRQSRRNHTTVYRTALRRALFDQEPARAQDQCLLLPRPLRL